MAKSIWYLYIIEATNGYLYTGVTTDLERRFKEHLDTKKGAKFFRHNKPKKIVFSEKHKDRSSAQKRESFIKSLARSEKVQLIKLGKKFKQRISGPI